MSGLDFIMKRAVGVSLSDSLKSPPKDIESATKEIAKYIESNLPLVIEVDFIPLCFDLTSDQDKIIMGGIHGNLGIFDLNSMRTIKDMELCACAITSTYFALEDTMVIVTNKVMVLYLIQFPLLETMFSIPSGPNPISIRLGLNKESILVVDHTEGVVFYDMSSLAATGKLSKKSINPGEIVHCIDITDDGSLIAFGLGNNVIKLYHGETESELQSTEAFEQRIKKICFSQFHRLMSVALADNSVTVIGISSVFTTKHNSACHKGKITSMAFVREDRYLVTGGEDGLIIMYDMKLERSPYYLELFDHSILWFKPSIDHKKLFYTQFTNKLMIWSPPVLSKNTRYRKHTKEIAAVSFVKGSQELISIGEDGLAIIWDCRSDTFQEILDTKCVLRGILVSSTSQFAILSTQSPSFIRWNLSTFKTMEFKLPSQVLSMNFSLDEKFIAVGDEQYRILIYSVVGMERVCIIKGHTQTVTQTHFVRSNEFVISSSRDHSIALWSLDTLEKARAFYGHSGPVTCLLVTADESLVISGSEDRSVIIWTLDGILMHNIAQESSVISLYLSSDSTYLVTIEQHQMSYWQMQNLSLMFQRETYAATSFAFSEDEKLIARTHGNFILIEENPLKSELVRVVGKNHGSSHKFMNYILQILNDNIRGEHLEIYNHGMFTPYNMSIAHLLAYKNKYEILYKVLIESEKKAAFCSTINNENPLSVSVAMDHKTCIEICLKYLKKQYRRNKFAYVPLGNCLTDLNKLDIGSIPKLYKTLFEVDRSVHLPNYCTDSAVLPKIYYSDSALMNVEPLLPREALSTHGQSIVFYHSLCPLAINTGSAGSINFLESLLKCEYPEIFRTKFVQTLLRDKWQTVTWAIYAQGMLYILYLVMLSFYCIVFVDSHTYLGVLFIVHVLLFMYEVIQIATDFYDYWKDVWNILDQLRGISFSLYAFCLWFGESDSTILLIVIIFSWTRGISYFRMFEGTRYMVRLLSEVIKDMQVFFIILFYSTLAFSFILYLNNPKYTFSKYVTVSYRLDLGDFENDYEGMFDWIIFFLATVINPLIMLNLLISIMSDTYSKVQETNDIANYQELTEMIIEIEKLMFWKRDSTLNHYLQQCDYLKGKEQSENTIMDKIKSMKSQLNSIQTEVHLCLEEIGKNNESNRKILEQNLEILEKTNNLLQKIDGK